jgi:hypothetical protein
VPDDPVVGADGDGLGDFAGDGSGLTVGSAVDVVGGSARGPSGFELVAVLSGAPDGADLAWLGGVVGRAGGLSGGWAAGEFAVGFAPSGGVLADLPDGAGGAGLGGAWPVRSLAEAGGRSGAACFVAGSSLPEDCGLPVSPAPEDVLPEVAGRLDVSGPLGTAGSLETVGLLGAAGGFESESAGPRSSEAVRPGLLAAAGPLDGAGSGGTAALPDDPGPPEAGLPDRPGSVDATGPGDVAESVGTAGPLEAGLPELSEPPDFAPFEAS